MQQNQIYNNFNAFFSLSDPGAYITYKATQPLTCQTIRCDMLGAANVALAYVPFLPKTCKYGGVSL